nr:branched-chain amino acid ABC transporter permease [Microbacterium bovistercoris]
MFADITQTLIGGIVTGSVYALIALGMSLIYSMSKVINLSQGAFVVLAALVAVTIDENVPMHPVVLLILVGVVFAALFAGLDAVVIRPGAKRAGTQRLLLITIGVLQAVGGLLLVVWGNNPYTMNPFGTGNDPSRASVVVGGVHLSTQYFWVVGILLLSVLGLWLLLSRTPLGLTMRATAEDATAAALQGVSVDRVRLIAFSIAGAMAGLAGTAIVPLTFMQYDTVVPYAVNGFIAAVVGGLGSSGGAVAGGLLLGIVNAVFGRYLSADWASVLSIAVLLLLLLVRPSGILGRASAARL